LLQCELELSGVNAFGFLAEQPLAQDVELMPQCGDLTLQRFRSKAEHGAAV
jgi:hypothetical protein